MRPNYKQGRRDLGGRRRWHFPHWRYKSTKSKSCRQVKLSQITSLKSKDFFIFNFCFIFSGSRQIPKNLYTFFSLIKCSFTFWVVKYLITLPPPFVNIFDSAGPVYRSVFNNQSYRRLIYISTVGTWNSDNTIKIESGIVYVNWTWISYIAAYDEQ